ncbi:MAG: Elongation factor 2 [Methanonatronarchaeales archaeon]|nr:Elongation factor 2 [Methanonatronarchaeales archaeon]
MGRRSRMAERVKALMDRPSHIRNIGIVAHIDHGKCVSGDARVSLADGSVLKAEDLYERIRSGGEAFEYREGKAFRPGFDVYAASLDRGEGETVEGKVTHACRLEADEPLVKVETSNGRVLETTPEHRYLTLSDDGVMEFERADSLGEGDVIVGARRVPCRASDSVEAILLEELSKDYGFYVELEEPLSSKLKEYPREELYEISGSELKEGSFKHAVWRGGFRLRDAVNVCKGLDIPLEELHSNIGRMNYRGAESRGSKSSLDMELPEDLEPLFYLAGVYFGDGDLEGNVTSNSGEMKALLEEKAKSLGFDTTVREFEDRGDRVELGGKTLLKVLQNGFAYPEKDKSGSIDVPKIVYVSSDRLAASFVRGYMDADGGVEESRSAVSVSSKSTGMLDSLQLLLYRFDVASKLNRENSTLYVLGELSLENYRDIGFSLTEKLEKYEELLSRAAPAKVDSVPISGETLRGIRQDVGAAQSDLTPSYSNYENGEVGLSKNSLRRITERFESLDSENSARQRISRLRNLAKGDTSFVEVVSVDTEDRDHVYDFGVEEHRNFVCEGIIVHNTTLTDNLLAGAGMISEELAGQQLFMDFDEEEQERGITIDAANVSMVHEFDDDSFLINLIDTPGHVDFGGDVTRAMRAVDGGVVVVDAVEGVMPQTEQVLRQALRENVKPTLFINKIDRLINELKLGPGEMQQKFVDVIGEVNRYIEGQIENEGLAEKWSVSVQDGSVAFGSALYNWALSVPHMERSGITFEDIIDHASEQEHRELYEKAPLHRVVLNMVIRHLPNPNRAQRYRVPTIWCGDTESEAGRAMMECDPGGPLAFMVTDISVDPHAGEVAAGRLFGGTLRQGDNVFISDVAGKHRLQNVGIFMGAERINVDEVPAGNIAAATGLWEAIAGSTVTQVEDFTPFESIQHLAEPVVTVAVEAEKMNDLPKLVEVLRQVGKEDPTIQVTIDEETGEHLISGMGELHLEVIGHRIERDKGVPIVTSEPIVVYRETVRDGSPTVEGKSPNKHNRFYFTVEPLPDGVVEGLRQGEISMNMQKTERRDALVEAGMEKDDASDVQMAEGPNLLVDATKGVQYLRETMELIEEGFEEVMQGGPMADEPCQGLVVRLEDVKLHEDAIHRGPAQVIPAVRDAVKGAIVRGDPVLLEPVQRVFITSPQEVMGGASREVQGRRGTILDMEQEGDTVEIEAKAPVAEMFGFAGDLRSATEGRAVWSTEHAGFDELPGNLQDEIVREIRERKGLKLYE